MRRNTGTGTGCALAGLLYFVGVVFAIVANVALIAAGVWAVVKVLQLTGVL